MVSDTPKHLGDILAAQSLRNPKATALIWDGDTIDYFSLYQSVRQTATAIASQYERGSRIGILGWNSRRYIELLYAIPLAGCVAVPLNARLSAYEIAQQIDHVSLSCLFADKSLLDNFLSTENIDSKQSNTDLASIDFISLDKTDNTSAEYNHSLDWLQWNHDIDTPNQASLPDIDIRSPAWLLFTSGTTGKAKAATLTHSSIVAGLKSGSEGRPVQQGDRYLYAFPLFHISAHNVLLQHLHGAAVVLMASFNAQQVLQICRDMKITTLSLAPTMIAMLLDHPDFQRSDLASVRTIGYGASAISTTLLSRIMHETDVELSQGYGMTELSGSVAFLSPEDHRQAFREESNLLASAGKMVSGIEVCLLDGDGQPVPQGSAGEIALKGPQLMHSYWNDQEANAAAWREGWFRTGDIGQFDSNGYLTIVDRLKDIIVSGGENVSSREVENVLLQHAWVKEACVVGLPDKQWGEAVCAVLVLSEEGSRSYNNYKASNDLKSFQNQLTDHCRTQLANYKSPKKFSVTTELIYNASGKANKAAIKATVF